MSYFPDKAELFIKTQEHAAKVEGKKNVWWNIRHKTKGYGLNGDEIYQKDQIEYLGVKGFTGESLVKTIGEVDRLRGTAGDVKSDQYYQSVKHPFL